MKTDITEKDVRKSKMVKRVLCWTASLVVAITCIPFNAGHLITAGILFVMGCMADEE